MTFKTSFSGSQSEGTLIYRSAEYSFDTVDRQRDGFTSIVLNELQLEVDDSGRVTAVWGYCPHTSWQKESVPLPRVRRGSLTYVGDMVPGVSIRANRSKQQWRVRYDAMSGYISVSTGGVPKEIEAVEFISGCYAAVDDQGTLVCLWLKPQQGTKDLFGDKVKASEQR